MTIDEHLELAELLNDANFMLRSTSMHNRLDIVVKFFKKNHPDVTNVIFEVDAENMVMRAIAVERVT